MTDEAGMIVKVTIVTTPASGSDAGTYLVTWNGHGDALALWRQNADGTLSLANSYTYDTWGRPATATHNGLGDLGFRFLYVGSGDVQWDNAFGLDLTYMHARHYSPVLGRFLQPDPAAAEANLYAYTGNSPVTTVDTTGLDSTNIGLNAEAGEDFEIRYLRYLRRFGWNVTRHVWTKTTSGWRIIDIEAVKDGRMIRIELKTGASRYEGTSQFLKDLEIARVAKVPTHIARYTRGIIRSYRIDIGGSIRGFGGGSGGLWFKR